MNKDEENTKSNGITWEEVSDDHYVRLLRYAVKLTDGNEDDARDLLQDAFCKVLRYAINPNELDNPAGYLAKVLKNLRIDKLKKLWGIRMESIDEANDDEEHGSALLNKLPKIHPDAERQLENEDYHKALRIAMHNLTPREKELLILFLKGYECDEIAAMLRIDFFRAKFELNAVRAKVRYRLDRQTKTAKP